MKGGNVLMVCLGNICRSPLAHGILEKLLDSSTHKVDSAGTAAYHIGSPPDVRSIQIALEHGIDISAQRARKFVKNDLERFDYIFAMDAQNYVDILDHCSNGEQRSKVKLLLGETEVEDPYYGSISDFERVYQKIEKGCQTILEQWDFKS